MPSVVRLPAEVTAGELRVWWGTDEGRGDFFVHGPQSVRLFALAHFAEKGTTFEGSLTDRFQARQEGLLKTTPSFLEKLEAAGFDPATMIFSIRRKDQPPVQALPAEDLRGILEDAQEACVELSSLMDEVTETKGVYVLSEDDLGRLRDKLEEIAEGLRKALHQPAEGA